MSAYSLQSPSFQGPDGQEDMPWLLTPGPLTTSRMVKFAALADWGSREAEFISLVQDVRQNLLRLAGADETYASVLMQGSGTAGMEAALGTFAPAKRKKTLVISNGRYGERAIAILERLGRPVERLDKGDARVPTSAEVAAMLDADKAITHVWMAHCETTSGIINPLEDISHEVKTRGRVMMVDAMSSFGALPVDMLRNGIDVMVSSPNKCLEGLPGFSIVVARRDLLLAAEGHCHSVVLDLHDQWKTLEASGQFRFTPPTHAIVAFRQALRELEEEGGMAARLQRYQRNANNLIQGLMALGLVPLQTAGERSPIIQTILSPKDPNFEFAKFHAGLKQRGFVIYPGALMRKPSFRLGTIGRLDEPVIRQVISSVEHVLKGMNVKDMAPEK